MTGNNEGAVFLTGATGHLGSALLGELLEQTDRQVHVLVRPDGPASATARVRRVMKQRYGVEDAYEGRYRVVTGDITSDRLGLSDYALDALAEEVGLVVHAAASVRFDLPSSRAHTINVEGTRRMIDFGDRCARRGDGLVAPFIYTSTAYAAGTRGTVFLEGDRSTGPWRNTYEASKARAERVVDGADLPTATVRPSVVACDAASGYTDSWNVLYPYLEGMVEGTVNEIPANPQTVLDVVPVDWVARMMLKVCAKPPDRKTTYHLVAGEDAHTVGELVELFNETLGSSVRLTEPTDEGDSVLAAFAPYLVPGPAFGNAATRTALATGGPPRLMEYAERLVAYAQMVGFGERPFTLPQARAWAAHR